MALGFAYVPLAFGYSPTGCLPTGQLVGCTGPKDEVGQHTVEFGVALHGVAVAFEYDALCIELPLEHVADRIERRMMRARDDELRKRCRSERSERDLGLPRAALDDECLRALLELGRQRRGWVERRADGHQEPPQERLGIVPRTTRIQLLPAGGERRGRRSLESDTCRGRLDHRERSNQLGLPGGCEERDHTAV